MINLQFKITNQTIIRDDNYVIVAGSKNYLNAVFTFSDEWDGLIKHVIFSKEGIAAVDLILEDDACSVPYSMTADSGEFTISVYADDLVTVNTAEIEVQESGYIQTEPTEPPDTQSYVKSSTGTGSIEMIKTVDGILYQYNGTEWVVVEGIQGEQGIQGNPSTLDKVGTATAIIDLTDSENGAYGTIDNPLTVAENITITFANLSLATGYQKSFIIYVKRTADVSVTWQDVTKWSYDEIPVLTVGKVQKILIETNGTNYYGTGGDYFNV